MIRRAAPLALALALALALLAAGCAASPEIGGSQADHVCGLRPMQELPVTLERNVPLVPGTIGGAPVTLVLDTGADTVLLTAAAARRLGLADSRTIRTITGAGGSSRNYGAQLRDFRIGSLAVPNHTVAVLPRDLPHVGATTPDGLLGVTVLSAFDIDLDLPRGRLTLYGGWLCQGMEGPPWTGAYTPIPAEVSGNGRLSIVVMIDGTPMRALLDTGAQVSVIAADAAARAGVGEQALSASIPAIVQGTGPETVAARVHRFREVQVGNDIFRGPTMMVAERLTQGADVILGMDYLSRRRIWLSFARQRIYVATP